MKRLFAVGTADEANALAGYFGRTSGKTPAMFHGGDRFEDDAIVQVRRVTQLFAPEDYDPKLKEWKIENLPIIPHPHWKRKPIENAEDIIESYRQLITWADVIYNAAEDDRRTHLALAEIMEQIGMNRPVWRMNLYAYDNQSVGQAIVEAQIDERTTTRSNAAKRKEQFDWLIGHNLTPYLSVSARTSGFPITKIYMGRLRAAILATVLRLEDRNAERDRIEYFEVWATCLAQNGRPFALRWKAPTSGRGVDIAGRIVRRDVAQVAEQRIRQAGAIVINTVEDREERVAPPPPPILWTLQRDLARLHGYSPADVAESARLLARRGWVSRVTTTREVIDPRLAHLFEPTCGVIERAVSQLAPAAVAARLGGKLRPERIAAERDGGFAIVPLAEERTEPLMTVNLHTYEHIARRYIAQGLGDLVRRRRLIHARSKDDELAAELMETTDPGWTITQPQKDDADFLSPNVHGGETVRPIDVRIRPMVDGDTEPITYADILDALNHATAFVENADIRTWLGEHARIGTDTTQAETLRTLIDERWLKYVDGNLGVSEEGRAIHGALPPAMRRPSYALEFDRKIEAIAEGSMEPARILEELLIMIDQTVKMRPSFGPSARWKPKGKGGIAAERALAPTGTPSLPERGGGAVQWEP